MSEVVGALIGLTVMTVIFVWQARLDSKMVAEQEEREKAAEKERIRQWVRQADPAFWQIVREDWEARS